MDCVICPPVVFGSEGWGFESLRARHLLAPRNPAQFRYGDFYDLSPAPPTNIESPLTRRSLSCVAAYTSTHRTCSSSDTKAKRQVLKTASNRDHVRKGVPLPTHQASTEGVESAEAFFNNTTPAKSCFGFSTISRTITNSGAHNIRPECCD